MEYASLGVQILDKALEGGIPKGQTVLVTGTPGCGIELFAKQFASAGVGTENVVYIATVERDEEVLSTMKKFGWREDIKIINIGSRYYESVLAKRLEVSKHRYEGLTMKDIMRQSGPVVEDDRVNFLTSLTYEVSSIAPPFRLVVDSLDFFLEYYDHSNVLSSLRTIKARAQHSNSLALFTMLKGVYDMRTESGMEEIVDVVIELERQREGMEFTRNLLVKKVRNHPERTGIFPIDIGAKGFTAKAR
jgi:KaiC/GvpD/RAD55 family RecA-like ATPase